MVGTSTPEVERHGQDRILMDPYMATLSFLLVLSK